ncbi:hypothetical protein XELAEV_18029802mg [Xenopus laevis]|uniref:Stress-associated endoplasmic reticulum protein n=1 Tax=Xenopus laevis TaxID=8355 RepID=A0A974CSF1_XENLA|nr:hypothetical protein XELAEV_18029802mg [Xenopus laevis]
MSTRRRVCKGRDYLTSFSYVRCSQRARSSGCGRILWNCIRWQLSNSLLSVHTPNKASSMVAKQRIRMANEKHSKNITQRGNVAKSTKCDGGEICSGTLVTGALYLRGLWIRYFPDYSEHQDGHVKKISPLPIHL